MPPVASAPRPVSLRRQTLILLAVAFLPVCAAGLALAYVNYRQAVGVVEQVLLRDARELATARQEQFLAVRQAMEAVAQRAELRQALAASACEEALRALLPEPYRDAPFRIAGPDGKVRCATAPSARSVGPEALSAYGDLIARQHFFIASLPPAKGQEPQIVALLPWQGDEQGRLGDMGLWLQPSVLERPRSLASESVGVALVDYAGRPVSIGEWLPDKRLWLPPAELLRSAITSGHSVFQGPLGDSEAGVFALSPILDGSLFALVGRSGGPLFGPLERQLYVSIGLCLAVWLGAVVAAWYLFNRQVLRWITRLRGAAMAYAGGEPGPPLDDLLLAPVEMKDLGEAMGAMAASLSKREAYLSRALDQQRSLLREMHHRVKNNLQLVSSLVSLQLRRAGSGPEIRSLERTQSRIAALSLAHRSLYESQDHRVVRLDQLVRDLAEDLEQAGGEWPSRHVIELELEPVPAHADVAVTFALLVSEALSNAVQHSAATAERPVRIVLARRNGGLGLAIESSSPPGDPMPGETPESGLGTLLIDHFAAQLGGTVQRGERDGSYRLEVRIARLPGEASLIREERE